MILRIGLIVLSLLVGPLVAENAANQLDRAKRQSQYQYVNFDLPNTTNQFQFAPPQPDPSQYAHFQNQFQNYNPRPAADQFNTNSIRRYPQFPNAAPANEEPLISVLSGSNQFPPSQSVSWNPPPTNVPPQVSNARPAQVARAAESSQNIFKPEPPLAKPAFPLEDSVTKPRVNLQAGNTNLVAEKPSAGPSTTNSTTSKDGKKDDVVIYYYYYYDDDKNKTDGLDTIPSLEGFDSASKAKPGKVIIKNDNFVPPPKEATPQSIIPLRVESRNPSQSAPQSPSFAPQPNPQLNKLQESFPAATTERPTTQSMRTTPLTLENQGLISNIFRYGSSSAAPNIPSVTAEPRPFTAEPQFNFESNKVAEAPKIVSSENSDKLPNFASDKIDPETALGDINTTPLQTLSPSTWRTTVPTTTTTTTTTTPAPTTTTTTTTTTTPAPATEISEAPKRRFGHRQRPGIGAGRPNPLNRVRSSTTTTTTTAAPTTERRSFTRPSPQVNTQRRQNRFRKRPGFGSNADQPTEDGNSDAATPSAGTTTATAAPSRETSAPRGRFGGRSRFGSNRQQQQAPAQSQPSSTTPAPAPSTESSNAVSTTRRSYASRGRPQLRGGNRVPFGRSRTKPPTEEVTPDPNEASTASANEASSAAAPVESANESATESSASNNETAESAATEASSTEKPQRGGRQKPLFGARPRPSLFGRRGQPASEKK